MLKMFNKNKTTKPVERIEIEKNLTIESATITSSRGNLDDHFILTDIMFDNPNMEVLYGEEFSKIKKAKFSTISPDNYKYIIETDSDSEIVTKFKSDNDTYHVIRLTFDGKIHKFQHGTQKIIIRTFHNDQMVKEIEQVHIVLLLNDKPITQYIEENNLNYSDAKKLLNFCLTPTETILFEKEPMQQNKKLFKK